MKWSKKSIIDEIVLNAWVMGILYCHLISLSYKYNLDNDFGVSFGVLVKLKWILVDSGEVSSSKLCHLVFTVCLELWILVVLSQFKSPSPCQLYGDCPNVVSLR